MPNCYAKIAIYNKVNDFDLPERKTRTAVEDLTVRQSQLSKNEKY